MSQAIGAVPPLSIISGYFGGEWDEEDPASYEPYRRLDFWASSRSFALCIQKKYGNDRMAFWKQEEAPEYEEGKTDYTKMQLGLMADELLRKDAKREFCRECLEEGRSDEPYGQETGVLDTRPVLEKDGSLKLDEEGNVIVADYPQFECDQGHTWFLGEGKDKSIQGKNAILFEEHLQTRRKREIYTQIGTPDPSIVAGIYNRTHPQGRKVNSPEQRKKNGASFFR